MMEKTVATCPSHQKRLCRGYICLYSQNSKAVLRSLNTLAKVVAEKTKLRIGTFIPKTVNETIPQNGFNRDHAVILEFHPNPQIKGCPPHACCDSVRGGDSGILPWPISKELSPPKESVEKPCR